MSRYYRFGTELARVCFALFGRVERSGAENVPPFGPLIVVANHMSNADIPLITTTVPRHVQFMAKRSLFKNPMASHVLHGLRAYPLERDGHDFEATRWALRQLSEDHCLGIFPEGSRSLNGSMNKATVGAAYLGIKAQAPILPVAIWGSEKLGPMWRVPFAFARLYISVGQPFTLPAIEGKLTRPVLEHLADTIMWRIAAMLPESYRGHYSHSPQQQEVSEAPCSNHHRSEST